MSEKKSVHTRIREFQSDMKGVEIIKKTEAYGYYYATLNDILDIITPVLEKNELWFYHYTSYESDLKMNTLTTVIYSTDNEDDSIVSKTLIDGSVKLGGMNGFMVEGSAITYFRRYHITTMLGLTTDEDTDATGKRVKVVGDKVGRSVEASTKVPTKTDFIVVFTGLLEKKTKAQIEKTFGIYKAQMDNEEIKAVQKLINDKYGS